jgi:hypothetical protein
LTAAFAAAANMAKTTAMAEPPDKSDTPPDRLSNDPQNPYYDAAALAREVGIRFKGAERTNVEEYCVSEGWIRVVVGNGKDRHGNPLTLKIRGAVEPYFKK